jgi:hypothetical protein
VNAKHTPGPIMTDARYTTHAEFCGEYEEVPGLPLGAAWVARFCGDWIGRAHSQPDAVQLCEIHQAARMGEQVPA